MFSAVPRRSTAVPHIEHNRSDAPGSGAPRAPRRTGMER
jgi:hypothetical protein